MKALICAAVLAAATVVAHADEKTLGAGVTLKEATPLASVLAKPGEFVGKKIRVDGVATAVCTGNGCWMAIAASDSKDAPALRVKVEDGVIVIPVSAKGKKVSAEGVFELVSDEHGKEAASEHAKATGQKHGAEHKHEPAAYHLKGTGIVIR